MSVEVKGLVETLKAMTQFEPDLKKNLDTEVRAKVAPVIRKARSYATPTIPGLSGWTLKTKRMEQAYAGFKPGAFPKYNSATVRAGIVLDLKPSRPNRNGFITQYTIRNKSAAGAIRETAGRKNPSGQPWDRKSGGHESSHSINPGAGLHFINSMGRMAGDGKSRGRLIYRAWSENQGVALAASIKAVEYTLYQFKIRADAQIFKKVA